MSWIEELSRKVNNPTPLMKNISRLAIKSILRNFQIGGRPERWQESIRAKMRGGKTLTLTGKLRNSIKAAIHGYKIDIGSNLKYAKIQQEGGTITAHNPSGYLKFPIYTGKNKKEWRAVKSVTLPARPFLIIPESDRKQYEEAIRGYFFK